MTPRLRHGYSVATSRGDAAAATWIFRGDESRRRRRGHSVETCARLRYINPLPALGVSLEIRPLLLAATTASERVDAAVAGISSSISHLDGTKRLW